MNNASLTGRVHSIQSMGTLDGPGVRFVVFLQGCNLRCGCCHNPDTWNCHDGTVYEASDIVRRACRFREYFGKSGGITLSGGEPLLQPDFAREVFRLCHAEGINTCLDTSGSVLNEDVKRLLSVTDRVLLDIKYTSDGHYRRHVGCALEKPLAFLDTLQQRGISTTIRQVIIPTLNGTEDNIRALKAIADAHPCVDSIELLPFRKVCQVKYDALGIPFPMADLPTPDKSTMEALNALL